MIRSVHRKNVFPHGGAAWYLLHELEAARPFESVIDDGYPLGIFVVVHAAIMVTHHDDIVDITHGGLYVRRSNLREQLAVDIHLVRRPVLFDCHSVMVGHTVRILNQEKEGGKNPNQRRWAEVRVGRKVDTVHVIINGRVLGAKNPREASWVTNIRLRSTVTLLLFRAGTPPGFCCRGLFCLGSRLSLGGGLRLLPGLDQLVTGKLIYRFLLFIVIVIIPDLVVVLFLKLAHPLVAFNHRLTS